MTRPQWRRKRFLWSGIAAAYLVTAGACHTRVPEPEIDYAVKPVPVQQVRVEEGFWVERQQVLRQSTLPHIYDQLVKTGRIALFEQAAAALQGHPPENPRLTQFPFDDTDVYKWLEAVSFWLAAHPDDAELDRLADEVIAKVAAAQEPDGYLYTFRTIAGSDAHPWLGKERWELVRDLSHELYNLGHLFEAAVAHYQATGKRNLLDVALKAAELLDRTFGPGKESVWPGHEVVEMALVKLYRVTGDPRWLNLAKFMLDQRGPDGKPGSGREYNQSHKPVIEQDEAVGHAVRAVYLYSGMADVAALAGVDPYWRALEKIWNSVVGRKMYVTGGIGATGNGEAFAGDYELPNLTAYAETCAAIGSIFWNERMFQHFADAKYIDVLERTLYNAALSGISLDGKSFFYTNPLESRGQHGRTPWFACACCPPNIARLLASVGGYVYARDGDSIYVNLFVGSSARVELEGGRQVRIRQQTQYPWEGEVRLTIEPEEPGRFVLRVRIPGWARGQAIPSDLYRFADENTDQPEFRLNGEPVDPAVEAGYAVFDREWKAGDTVAVTFPMPARRLTAHEQVVADRGRIALQRGPLVYCLEGPDHPGGKVRNVVLPDGAPLEVERRPDLLGGVTVIRTSGKAYAYDARGRVEERDVELTAIPYYAWANRGPAEMVVWIPRDRDFVTPAPYPTPAMEAKVSVSGGRNRRALNDGEVPATSGETSYAFHWWPRKGTTEWVEYTFGEPRVFREARVYWFDDTGRGEVRLPASWRVLYKKGEEWVPVQVQGPYEVAKDRFCRVRFTPVRTTALRLEVTLQPNWSAGIHEWDVR
ncbi:MAG: glycoside hydrolase family 127 protein [Acidobacteriota bacterium]